MAQHAENHNRKDQENFGGVEVITEKSSKSKVPELFHFHFHNLQTELSTEKSRRYRSFCNDCSMVEIVFRSGESSIKSFSILETACMTVV
jgi:hypothetical protein